MADLLVKETGNGGDLLLKGNDLAMVDGAENMPYLAMFGGQEGNNEWWGRVLLPDQADVQFKSETNIVYTGVALNSAGRLAIEQAINRDLNFLKTSIPGTTITVNTVITSDDRIETRINISGQTFAASWNPDSSFINYTT